MYILFSIFEFEGKQIMLSYIQQRYIKLTKSDIKDIYNIKKIFIFQLNAVLLNFLLITDC